MDLVNLCTELMQKSYHNVELKFMDELIKSKKNHKLCIFRHIYALNQQLTIMGQKTGIKSSL